MKTDDPSVDGVHHNSPTEDQSERVEPSLSSGTRKTQVAGPSSPASGRDTRLGASPFLPTRWSVSMAIQVRADGMRALADYAWAAGCKQVSGQLHDMARALTKLSKEC